MATTIAPQSYEFWHALKTLGVETMLVVYEHERHHFANPQAYYSQEVRRPRKNYTPGSSQLWASRAQNLPYSIEI